MNERHLQSALREWRALFSAPGVYIVLCGVAALLAILGPFGTDERLSLVERLIYWLVMAAGTYSIGFVINTWLANMIGTALPKLARIGVVSVATGAGIAPFITLQNYISFGYWPSAAEWSVLLVQFFVISLIVTVIFQTVSGQMDFNAGDVQIRPPTLLGRLPFDKRGDLVALSSEDHYTLIQTTKGESLVLIRLTDAIKEAEPTKGIRVHRSHWVALDQVSAARREGARAFLMLSTGNEIPVSRSLMTEAKQAGLLLR
ncbi:LytTR family DNA-binding domain-containing protein [Sulfitobacter sp. SK012]|uniref:LytTR family DNA-binding domain-containing protein n=1 Tax=Sulfitobacter sp. SK012 TaxID=1389005 RepID=UPI0013B43EB6|nr:LytTR family DNA-binding domain-containing protein [Sulfitobacter sp. SK012]